MHSILYCRLIRFWLRIASFYTRSNQKNCSKKNTQCIILHVTTPLLLKHVRTHDCKHAKPSWSQMCLICLHACVYSCYREWVFAIDSTVNLPTPSHAQLLYMFEYVVWYSINSPPHMQPILLYNIEGVAFSFGNSQSLESQSGLQVCMYV